jgi:hypothetical protein
MAGWKMVGLSGARYQYRAEILGKGKKLELIPVSMDRGIGNRTSGTAGALFPVELEYDTGGGMGPGHYTGH